MICFSGEINFIMGKSVKSSEGNVLKKAHFCKSLAVRILAFLLIFSVAIPSFSHASTVENQGYLYITSNTAIEANQLIDKTVVISPNVTLTIPSSVQYTITRNFIIYGTLINNGSLIVSGDIYANNYNNFMYGDLSNPAGKINGWGGLRVNGLYIDPASYPAPLLNITSPADGKKVTTNTAEISAESFPGMQYEVNGKSGIVGSDGNISENIGLQEGQNEITIIVTDVFGNKNTNKVNVNFKPITKPVVSEVTDKDTTVAGQAEAGFSVEVKANGAVIGTGIAGEDGSFTVTIPVQNAGTKLGITAADDEGNVSKVTEVTVKDTEKPTINGAVDRIVAIGKPFDTLNGVTAIDNLDGDLTSKIIVTGNVNHTKLGIYSLTYAVTDQSGNTAKVTRKITVVDNIKPIILGTTAKTININSSFNPKTGVTAKDNADGDLTSVLKVTGTVNVKKKGTYTLTYTVTDQSGNTATVTRKITVVDNIKPAISGAADTAIAINSAFDPKTGVTAKDNVDGDLTSVLKVTGTVNVKKKGTYTLTYMVTDQSGNTATVTRKITVIDNVKPVISGATAKSITINSAFNPKTGVTARDNVDGDLTGAIKITGTVNPKKKGTYTLTYTVSDKSGNKAMITRKITVK
jgi:P2-related tail formation protein